jgi:hypothetical protein
MDASAKPPRITGRPVDAIKANVHRASLQRVDARLRAAEFGVEQRSIFV